MREHSSSLTDRVVCTDGSAKFLQPLGDGVVFQVPKLSSVKENPVASGAGFVLDMKLILVDHLNHRVMASGTINFTHGGHQFLLVGLVQPETKTG